MKQNEKDILLKDLCARLPYGVKFAYNKNIYTAKGLDLIVTDEGDWEYAITAKGITPIEIDFIKPYLFPMSSMTEEQKYDFYCRFIENDCDFDDFKEFYLDNGMWHKLLTSLDDIESIIDWFNKNHFDYRGLIEKGLANDATNLNIY